MVCEGIEEHEQIEGLGIRVRDGGVVKVGFRRVESPLEQSHGPVLGELPTRTDDEAILRLETSKRSRLTSPFTLVFPCAEINPASFHASAQRSSGATRNVNSPGMARISSAQSFLLSAIASSVAIDPARAPDFVGCIRERGP